MPAHSYYAQYHAVKEGEYLIGGVRNSQTSRFGSRADALLRLNQTIDINGGPEHCTGEVKASNQYPEIFAHCPGSIAQAIGGKCFKCGHVLTVKDAKKHAPID